MSKVGVLDAGVVLIDMTWGRDWFDFNSMNGKRVISTSGLQSSSQLRGMSFAFAV